MKFLILRLSSLGDIILTQPVLAELFRRYPGAEVHYVCKPQFADLPRMMGGNITVIPYEKSLRWHLALRRHTYHAVIDLHGKAGSMLIALMCSALRRVRYRKMRALRMDIVRHKSSASIRSTVDLYFSALSRLFQDEAGLISDPRLTLPEAGAVPFLPPLPEGHARVGIFPGAAHATKQYPIESWIGLIEEMGDKRRYLLLGSEADHADAEIIRRAHPDLTENLCGKLGLAELAHVIKVCDLILSGDTGPMHMAAALGVKQVAIFGGTHPRLGFAPLNPKAVVLSADLNCQPCSLHGLAQCPLGHFSCMRVIHPQMLKDAAESLLSD